jgi:hypothetical protein
LVCLLAGTTRADMEITASKADIVPKADNDPLVRVQSLMADGGGITSLRFSTDKQVAENPYPTDAASKNHIAPPSQRKVQQRDRDLGQTFLTGDQGFRVDALFVRVGPRDDAGMGKPVGPGVPGARVALQFFEMGGKPTLNDNGTPGFLRDAQGHPLFSRKLSPQLDDFLEGETYRSIHVVHGVLPQNLEPGTYLTFRLIGGDQVVLQPHTEYAFLLLFTERGPQRSMSLANRYFGTYTPDPNNPFVGHGIRREGGTGQPNAPFFRPDLPDDLPTRLAQKPDTPGFPDVDTFRDLYFTITAVPGSLFRSGEPPKGP